MKRILIGMLLLSCGLNVFAEDNNTASASDTTQASAAQTPADDYFFRADYLSIKMPSGQDNLGLAGLHLDKKFSPGFYTGLGLYSAVSGEYSGFFALGGELGWQHLIYRQLGFDTGVFVGTGGGKNTTQSIGNGSFVMPHVGLYYHFPWFNLGINYSNIRFNTNQVNSNQWTFNIDWPFQLFKLSPGESLDQTSAFDWSKNYIAAVGAFYHPIHSQFTSGEPLTNNTELVGVEFGHFFTKYIYNFFEFTGAVHGNSNGYANIFAGMGWQQPLGNSPFYITPRFAIGSGGGGGYDVGGGFLYYPSLGLGWQFIPHWQAEILSGYVSGTSGHFHAVTGELQIKHDFDLAVPGSMQSQTASFDTEAWRLRVGNQTYFQPQHDNGESNSNINLFAVKIDHFLTTNWYITGQTAFAYSGNAAGYFSGMLGAGFQTPDFYHFNVFTEASLGTAGGAGLSIQDGALAQLGIGANYQWSPTLGAYTEVSKLVAFEGGFNPLTLDVGLSYSFGLPVSAN